MGLQTEMSYDYYQWMLGLALLGIWIFDTMLTLTYDGYWIIATMPLPVFTLTIILAYILEFACLLLIIGAIDGMIRTRGMEQ